MVPTAVSSADMAGSLFSFSGEIGIVSRGIGELSLSAGSADDIFKKRIE